MGEVTSRPLSRVAGQVKEPFASAKADVTLASHSAPGAVSSPGRLPGVPCPVWSVLWGRLWEVPGFRDTHSSPCPLKPGWSQAHPGALLQPDPQGSSGETSLQQHVSVARTSKESGQFEGISISKVEK